MYSIWQSYITQKMKNNTMKSFTSCHQSLVTTLKVCRIVPEITSKMDPIGWIKKERESF